MSSLFGLSPLALIIAGFAAALLLSFVFTLGVERISAHYGWLDIPAPRRIHKHPVPRLGGVAMFVAFTLCSLLIYHPKSVHEHTIYIAFLVASLLMTVTMAIDDVRGIPPRIKLLLQTIAAIIVIYPLPGVEGMIIDILHNPLGQDGTLSSHISVPWLLAVPFTWFWIVGMMNTVNWIDGIDGLASGVVGITAVVLAVFSWFLGQPSVALLSAILAGCVLGFLPRNWNPAKIFMGDSGAMFLGLALAVLANIGGAKLATMLLVMGIPILDVALVILGRIRQHKSPLHYDKRHLHHRLLDSGMSQKQIVLIFYSLTAFFGLLSIISLHQVWDMLGITGFLFEGIKIVGLVLVIVAMVIIFMLLLEKQHKVEEKAKRTPEASGSV